MAEKAEDYRDEFQVAMQKVIARAWSDEQYKAQLISDPSKALEEQDLRYPDENKLEFYDDPSAKIGDWAAVGKGQTSVLRVPIPPPPSGGQVSEEELASVEAVSGNCCCSSIICCCCGAISLETWN